KRLQLANLYAAILERDNAAMETILEQMEHSQRHQIVLDGRMAQVRAAVAVEMGTPADTTRLATIIDALPAEQAAMVATRRSKIIELAERLRRQHMQTAMLLRECSRVNRMMLESLMSGGGPALTTYGAAGKNEWHSREGLLDTER
ncbi:MAG: hypothetical protein EHM48_05140, partial [Planctomycetaceae bacterium]